MNRTMKVLITGGTGTISSGIVQACVDKGFDVSALTRGNKKDRNIVGANYIYCDINDTENLKTILKNEFFDVVVECLSYTVEQLINSLSIFSNICTQYVFISTAGIYRRKGDIRIKETDEKDFCDWIYTKNKIDCEKYLIEYCSKHTLKYTIIRPTVTYGKYRIPFPFATRSPGWTFFQRLMDGKPMLASENVKFSIIHIDDFSRVVVTLFGNIKAYNEDFHICSTENEIYWDDVIYKSAEIIGVDPCIVHVPLDDIKKMYPSVYAEIKYNKSSSLLLDDTKIKEISGIDDYIHIEDGIAQVYKSMHEEFFKTSNGLDKIWNERCNATIYYAYKQHHLNSIEQNKMKQILKKQGISEFRNNMWVVSMKNIKRRLCSKISKS